MKNKRIIILIVFLIVLVLFVVFIFGDKDDEVEQEVVDIQVEKIIENRKYSRVTFFNLNKDMRSSLAIPEDWEGKYRISESGNKITFSFVVNPVVSYEIFSLSYVPLNDWNDDDLNKIKLLEKNESVFYYQLGQSSDVEGELQKELILMKNDIEGIVDSLK